MADAVVQKSAETRDMRSAKQVLSHHQSNELFFAVVGHVGSGTSAVATELQNTIESDTFGGLNFEVIQIKARSTITNWATKNGSALPTTSPNDIGTAQALQNLGDEMRRETGDHAAVARGMMEEIQRQRAQRQNEGYDRGSRVIPDGTPRVYILDSIRHPAEVALLRRVYQSHFTLIGVVCDESIRIKRIVEKFNNAGKKNAQDFMDRDADDKQAQWGQHVGDAFHEADFFLDNSEERSAETRKGVSAWNIPDELSRLMNIVTKAEVVRPTASETAMQQAYAAKNRSACLSRQVGASIIDLNGNIVATGTNEVPKAGGGLYGQSFGEEHKDDRCAVGRGYCSNTKEQNNIIEELVSVFPEISGNSDKSIEIRKRLRKTRIGGLLEFSRAVHAEMDAILSAARQGKSIVGSRLFVSTFPCHYCARHIVAAGLDEVQYIEPYPKSKALALHDDSIQVTPKDWYRPSLARTKLEEADDLNSKEIDRCKESKVLFRPFVGVAPRLYERAFLKDRDLKDPSSGKMQVGRSAWGEPGQLRKVSYVDLEADLVFTDE